MLVRATDMSMRLQVRIKELHRVATPGEEFEVSPMRFKVLSGENKYKVVFVTEVEVKTDDVIEEEVVNETVEENIDEFKEDVVNEDLQKEEEVETHTEVEDAPAPKKRGRKAKAKADE